MKKPLFIVLILILAALPYGLSILFPLNNPAVSNTRPDELASVAELKVYVDGFADNVPIPSEHAYCIADGKGKAQTGPNVNPSVSWDGAPEGTQSYAIIMVDPDVPVSFESANKEDKIIPEDFPRRNFYHWVLVDIPKVINHFPEGGVSREIIEGGKPFGPTGYGNVGQNDYAKIYPGPNGNYDGPCPPWNDERIHHYHIAVYALDVKALQLGEPFDGAQAMEAMKGHILAKGEVVGTYSTRPTASGETPVVPFETPATQ